MANAILYDATKCIGCKMCEQACCEKWGMPYDDEIGAQTKISSRKLTVVLEKQEKYARKLCMHCAEPACVSVCPVGAFTKTKNGPVVYEEHKCMGCRYCMAACPFQVPSYEWEKRFPRVKKCDMCAERQSEGQPTSCSEICPTEATITGKYEDMVAEAKKRLAESPSDYVPYIYGLREVGGTSVLMLSSVPFETFGKRMDLPKEPLPALTWRALSLVPDVVAMGGVLLGGIYWISHRREEVAAAERREKKLKARKETER